jgi:uncharacterized protein
MADLSPAAPRPAPVDARERVPLLDVLRGFALGGVFVSNAYMHLNGTVLLPRERAEALKAAPWDAAVGWLFDTLITGKAMALFSFLFGLGFALQLGRAEARAASIVPLYARRLGVLFAIGLVHRFGLWYGDVLATYAVMGFALLQFRALPPRRLLAWSLVLCLGGPLAVAAVTKLVPVWASSREFVRAFTQEDLARVALIKAETLRAFQSGDYLTTARANLTYYLDVFFRPVQVAYMLDTLGRFLLGLVAGRLLLFQDVERHRPLFRRLLGGGFAAAVVGEVLTQGVPRLLEAGTLPESFQLPWRVLQPSLHEVGVLGTATVYAAGFALLFPRVRWRRGLLWLAPAGQMALTNYLSQTVISQLVFYGYGFNLIGRLEAARCIGLMTALFLLQVGLSHLWMARFRFGPVEWVWRSLTYGQRQPLRREPPRPATPPAGEPAAR